MYDFSRFDGPSDEWLAVEKSLPRPLENQSLEEVKQTTNAGREAVAAKEFAELAGQLSTKDLSIPTRDGHNLEARTYRRTEGRLPLYIHFHGGGWFFGTLNSEDAACGRLAVGVEIVVLNVNYRHTPEHPYPVAWCDADDAVAWAIENASKLNIDASQIIVGGISAGGNLAASTSLRHDLKGQLLLIPNLVHLDCYEPQFAKMRPGVSSVITNKDAPILPMDRMRWFTDMLRAKPDPQDFRLSPGNASVKSPPTFIVVAGLDPLRDEGILFGQQLADNG